MTKEQARKQAREKIERMSAEEREWASGAIADYLSSFEALCRAHNVFIFLGTPLEPDTEEVVGLSLALERTVAVPRIEKDGMHAVVISPFTNFERNGYGILEPVGGHDITDVDVAVVPIAAFDGLNRVGHGKAYYDRFLQDRECLKIGIAFDCQEVSGVDFEAHDISLDMLVTETRVLTKDKQIPNPYGVNK